jgi:predicted enzyme related to lactoylglutathione lyase
MGGMKKTLRDRQAGRRAFLKLGGTAAAGVLAQTAGAQPQKAAGEAPNPIIHFEIGCRDSARTQQLYRALFDWKIEAASIQGAGIGGHINALGHEPQNYTMFYVQVDDVAAHIAKAESLGFKKLVGPIRIPTGTFAWIADPDGNTIGLLKPAAAA